MVSLQLERVCWADVLARDCAVVARCGKESVEEWLLPKVASDPVQYAKLSLFNIKIEDALHNAPGAVGRQEAGHGAQ